MFAKTFENFGFLYELGSPKSSLKGKRPTGVLHELLQKALFLRTQLLLNLLWSLKGKRPMKYFLSSHLQATQSAAVIFVPGHNNEVFSASRDDLGLPVGLSSFDIQQDNNTQ